MSVLDSTDRCAEESRLLFMEKEGALSILALSLSLFSSWSEGRRPWHFENTAAATITTREELGLTQPEAKEEEEEEETDNNGKSQGRRRCRQAEETGEGPGLVADNRRERERAKNEKLLRDVDKWRVDRERESSSATHHHGAALCPPPPSQGRGAGGGGWRRTEKRGIKSFSRKYRFA